MGVTFFWLSLRIPSTLTSEVAARFAEARSASPVSPAARRVLDRWRELPHTLSPEPIPNPDRPGTLMFSEGTEDFEALFRPEAMTQFGQGVMFVKGVEAEKWGIELTQENADLIITDRIPAAAALYFGLGADRAAQLPGHFGSFFVAPGDVGQVLPLVDAVLGRPSPEMLTRARRWLDGGNNESPTPEELFAFIPRTLRTAHARREGILLLSSRG